MKRTNKGFTLVELIIVIAVIGVLAAILIPVFSNVIEKANLKSAFADARNAISNYVADHTDGANGGAVFGTDGVAYIEVKNKGGADWYFVYKNNGLQEVTNAADAKGSTSTIGASYAAATETAVAVTSNVNIKP
jgi:type IV pilus assembly protein PilA